MLGGGSKQQEKKKEKVSRWQKEDSGHGNPHYWLVQGDDYGTFTMWRVPRDPNNLGSNVIEKALFHKDVLCFHEESEQAGGGGDAKNTQKRPTACALCRKIEDKYELYKPVDLPWVLEEQNYGGVWLKKEAFDLGDLNKHNGAKLVRKHQLPPSEKHRDDMVFLYKDMDLLVPMSHNTLYPQNGVHCASSHTLWMIQGPQKNMYFAEQPWMYPWFALLQALQKKTMEKLVHQRTKEFVIQVRYTQQAVQNPHREDTDRSMWYFQSFVEEPDAELWHFKTYLYMPKQPYDLHGLCVRKNRDETVGWYKCECTELAKLQIVHPGAPIWKPPEAKDFGGKEREFLQECWDRYDTIMVDYEIREELKKVQEQSPVNPAALLKKLLFDHYHKVAEKK